MGFCFPIGVPLGAFTRSVATRKESARETRLGGRNWRSSAYFRNYAPEQWAMPALDMERRLLPCWLLLHDSLSHVLQHALIGSVRSRFCGAAQPVLGHAERPAATSASSSW